MVSSKTYQGGLKMILKTNIITNLEINGLEDLHKLKPLMEHTNINRSQIARELGVDRRTVDKYINGFKKSEHRTSSNCLSNYQEKIRELLDDENDQVFYYSRNLWRYLVDNEGYTGSYPNFCGYLKKIPEFDSYFRKRRPGNGGKFIRYETEAGHQAQLDWKESMKLLTTDLGWIEVNIFVLILSFSRFRVYRMTFSRSQDILFSLLDDAFDTFGGIPDEILTDNMKTVMDEPRTKGSPGKVNPRFRQFADDYGFDVRPCVAATPRTKGKVESPMRILDELRAYNGRLDYMGFVNMLSKINDRENGKVHPTTGRIPVMYLDKERESFHKLPKDSIRTPYRMVDKRVKADNSSLFRYKGKLYSVPPEYIGLELTLQVHDGYLHVYSSTKLVALHAISDKGINYNEGHYEELIRSTHSFAEENIGQRAKENLKAIGALYE